VFRATIVRISPVAGVRVTMRAALVCLLCLTALVAVSAIPTISREMNAAQHDSVEEEIHKTFMDWKAKVRHAGSVPTACLKRLSLRACSCFSVSQFHPAFL
jgi:hypothetical protein